MEASLRQARGFRDVLGSATSDGPYVYAGIFSDADFRARWLSKKKFVLLKSIDEQLRPMLREGERVYYLTFGSSAGLWESYFLGWITHFVNRRAIVLTDRRVLFLQIDWRIRPRELRSQLDLRAIEAIERRGLGKTGLVLRNGKQLVFSGLPGADRKALEKVVTGVRNAQPGTGSSASGVEHLCPGCKEAVRGRPDACPYCGKAFRSARKAGLLSLLFPGLGYIYLGHWKFAILEIPFASAIWLGLLLPGPRGRLTAPEMLVGAILIVGLLHGSDALGAWHIGKKGHYPA